LEELPLPCNSVLHRQSNGPCISRPLLGLLRRNLALRMGNNTHCRHLSQRETGTAHCPNAGQLVLAALNRNLNPRRRDCTLPDCYCSGRNAPCFTECWQLKANLFVERFNYMKLLIGYDGSKCADDALDGLKYAGLPRKAETTVL